MGIPSEDSMHAALVARHGEQNQKKISAATVAICGLGGIGSNVAVSLARAGIGRLISIDLDRVDALGNVVEDVFLFLGVCPAYREGDYLRACVLYRGLYQLH